MKGQTFTTGEYNYTIYYTKGKVVAKDKNLETIVSGGGGGGGTYQGTGGNASISISSSTIIHDKIYLDIGNGKEAAIELSNWDIACREGHEMLFAWIIKEGHENGPYVAIKNFTTDYQEVSEWKIRKFTKENRKRLLVNSVGSCLVALLLLLSVLITFGVSIIGIYIWNLMTIEKSKETAKTIKKQIEEFLDSKI